MLPELDDYNWEEVFKYATPTACGSHEHGPSAVIGRSVSLSAFTREDVKRIIAKVDGINDEEDWLGVFELSDGRLAVLRAGCDYSGWG